MLMAPRRAALTVPAPAWRRVLPALGVAGLAVAILAPVAVEPGAVAALGHLLAAAAGAALLLLARSLWRGQRRAALVAAGALWALAGARLARGAPPPYSIGELVLGALLWVDRRAYTRGGARGACRPAALVAALAAACAYGVAVAALLATGHALGLGAALSRAGSWLVAGGWWMRSANPYALSLDLLVVLALAAAAAFLRNLLRPAEGAEGHTADMHRRAAELVARYGSGSLDPFALREDKSFHFAHGGFLAYRTLSETAVVSGDPVGPPGCAPAVLASFEAYAAERGWDVVITGAAADHLDGYRALGFSALRIGDEAVVEPERFSLQGRSIRKVRQAVARVERRGWRVHAVEAHSLGTELIARLAAIEREWRLAQPRLYGFAMTLGRLWGAEEDLTGVYVLARDPEGTVRGFLRFASYRGGLSLDVMRRPPEAPNGLNEAMVVTALEYARTHQVSEVSLNFAGFAHVMAADAVLSRRQRILRWALHRLHGRFQLERLVRFNDKFAPAWRPRYLVHRGPAVLPLAALRVLQAEAYIRPPSRRPLEHRWEPRTEPVVL